MCIALSGISNHRPCCSGERWKQCSDEKQSFAHNVLPSLWQPHVSVSSTVIFTLRYDSAVCQEAFSPYCVCGFPSLILGSWLGPGFMLRLWHLDPNSGVAFPSETPGRGWVRTKNSRGVCSSERNAPPREISGFRSEASKDKAWKLAFVAFMTQRIRIKHTSLFIKDAQKRKIQ